MCAPGVPKGCITISEAFICVSRLHQSGLECARGHSASVMSWLLFDSGCGTFLGITNQGILAGPKQVEPLIPKGRTLHFHLYSNLLEHAS